MIKVYKMNGKTESHEVFNLGKTVIKVTFTKGNLDPKNSWEIMQLLEEINEQGTTVIVVTHNREIVNAMQKRVIAMKKGIIVSDQEEGEYIDED